ncbi:MAG: hypothetical protein IPG39_07020 [Bacteroidetes bacterium]|nr:hypothetical protein [Bacteroidota bacterium]
MKKALMLLSISLLAGWFSLVQAQGTTGLKVTQMIGYPVLPDTAYEGVSYSITLNLRNYSNSTINGGVNVLLKYRFRDCCSYIICRTVLLRQTIQLLN